MHPIKQLDMIERGKGLLIYIFIIIVFTSSLMDIIDKFSPIVVHYENNSMVVKIDKNVNKQLLHFYDVNINEFGVCLLGFKSSSSYIITGLEIPDVISASPNFMSFRDCTGEDVIGFLHSHPYGKCSLSNQDISILEDKYDLNGVMCGEQFYGFYSGSNFLKSLAWVIV